MRQDTRCAVERIEEETGDVLVTLYGASELEAKEEVERRYPDAPAHRVLSPMLMDAPFMIWRVRLHSPGS